MSKISPLIAKYLHEHNTLTLESLGKFTLVGNTEYVDPNEKNAPQNSVSFEYDKNAKNEDEFISFIVKETGKIKPLATADLETYIILGKQLLNISKPLVIEGVGTLNKVSSGTLEFISGNFEPPKINVDNDRDRRSRLAKQSNKNVEKEINFEKNLSDDSSSRGKSKVIRFIGFLGLLALLGGAGYGIWHFLLSNKDTETATVSTNNTAKKDTIKSSTPINTTDTSLKPIVTTPPDSLGRTAYKMVIDVLPKDAALLRYNKLVSYKYKPLLYSKDSITYKIAIPMVAFAKDTTRIKDSLQRLFIVPAQIRAGKVVTIEQ
jgi:hypothetical protein